MRPRTNPTRARSASASQLLSKLTPTRRRSFHGRVSAIRLNAFTVQNVVTYDTIVDFENPDGKLLPGETAYVTIPTGHAANILLVANIALTFTPQIPPDAASRPL